MQGEREKERERRGAETDRLSYRQEERKRHRARLVNNGSFVLFRDQVPMVIEG